jgi:glycerophosphoryl diester phosphodiesterase
MNERLQEMIERVKKPVSNVAVIAHRGGSRIAPENTIPAFESAVAMGADMVELDVHLTADDRLVVHHNDDTEWLGCRNVVLAEANYSDVLECTFDGVFGNEFKDIRIPLLEDALMILKGHAIPVIEIKVGDHYRELLEDKLLDALRDFNLIGESVVVSFGRDVLRRIKEKEPLASAGYLTAVKQEVAEVRPDGIEVFGVLYEVLSEELLDKLRRCGKIVIVWTVNEEQNMKKFAEMGVDGIASDDPILLKKVLTGHY